jgi:hypothetical protein
MSRRPLVRAQTQDEENGEEAGPGSPVKEDTPEDYDVARKWYMGSGLLIAALAGTGLIVNAAMVAYFYVFFSSNLPTLGFQSTAWAYMWYLYPAAILAGIMRIVMYMKPCWDDKVMENMQNKFTYEIIEGIILRPANMGAVFFLSSLTDAWLFTALACITITVDFFFYLHEYLNMEKLDTAGAVDWVAHFGSWLARLTLWTILLAFGISTSIVQGISNAEAFLLASLITTFACDMLLGLFQGIRYWFGGDQTLEFHWFGHWMLHNFNYARAQLFLTTVPILMNVLVFILKPYYP